MTSLAEQVPGQIWVQERGVWFGGVRLRSRTTIVRLGDGKLWLHSPAEPTPEVLGELDRLGEVAWIIVPNRFHHLNAPAMKKRYPNAQIVGPVSVKPRNKTLVLDHDISSPTLGALFPELRSAQLTGVPFLEETTFFHEPSRTLIGADLMMTGCAKDHWSWRWVSRLFGQYGTFKAPPDVRMHTKASPDLRESLQALMSLPMERILVAHSDAIEERPIEQLSRAWQFVLGN
jgi:hypothetical protein